MTGNHIEMTEEPGQSENINDVKAENLEINEEIQDHNDIEVQSGWAKISKVFVKPLIL